MDNVARLPARDRAELFRETAAAKGLPPVPIEKDFWVLDSQAPLCTRGSAATHLQGRHVPVEGVRRNRAIL